jgi:HK97 family phage portal protein
MGWQDWIPPAFARKASAASRAIVMMTAGSPVWRPRDFEALAQEGFGLNVTVYACVMEIARAQAGVSWLLYQRGRVRGELLEIQDHPLLRLIERPNPEQGCADFFEASAAFQEIAGNAYMEAVGPDRGAPTELWNLRPDRVIILPDYQNRVGGYRYRAGGVEQDFEAAQVLHRRIFDPTSDWYGLSPLAVAARAVDSDNEAQAWNYALLKNSGRPSGALVAKGNRTAPQFASLKTDINELYTGATNAGRPLVLEGDMDWKSMALNAVDLDWLNGRKFSKLEICQAFGVPPELIGDHEHATYSNYQEARKAFYQETVLPKLDRLRDALNNWLTPKFGDRLVLDYDRDKIPALQEERTAVWSSALEAVGRGVLTPNEARERMGYTPLVGGDVLLVSATLLPLGAAPASEPVQADPAAKALEAAALSVKAFGLTTPEAKAAYWKSVDAAREAWAGKFASRVRALGAADAKAVEDAIRASLGVAEADDAATRALDGRKAVWERELTATYLAVIKAFGDATADGLKVDAGRREVKAFDLGAAALRAWVTATVARKVVLITETTIAAVRGAIVSAVASGGGLDEVAEGVRRTMGETWAGRSQTIARTEVIGAANYGSRAAALQTGLPLRKEWIATKDGRTRDEHASLDGQKVGMEDRYSNGLMFPGDPAGDGGDVINCRCVEGYEVEGQDPEDAFV